MSAMTTWIAPRLLFPGLAIVALIAGGCAKAPTLNWTDSESVETIASAIAISPDENYAQLYRALVEGEASAIEAFELHQIDRPFLLTAYAAPILEARRVSSPRFGAPIRGLPANHRAGDPLPSRKELTTSTHDAQVIAWVANPLDAYLAEVNGSVKLLFPEEQSACLAWVSTNDRPYTSIGRLLVERGHVSPEAINLAAIRDIHKQDPRLIEKLMLENQRAVFFEEIACDAWPRASTGAVLRPGRSVAVDPDVIPLGSVLVIETTLADGTSLKELVAAVDTGGAIRGGRIDLYLGDGPKALARAGAQAQSARVYRLQPRLRGEHANSQRTSEHKQP